MMLKGSSGAVETSAGSAPPGAEPLGEGGAGVAVV